METRKTITYELLREKPPKTYRLQSADNPVNRLIIRDAKGNVRPIRYCTNQASLYIDEQNPNIATPGSIVFEDGSKEVEKDEKAFHEFMAVHPGNESNGGTIFRVVDFEAMTKSHLSLYETKDKAVETLKKMDIAAKKSMLRAHDPNGFAEAILSKMSDQDVTLACRSLSETSPEIILEFYGENDDVAETISIAIDRGLIEVGEVKQGGFREIKKGYDDNAVLLKIRKAEDPVKKLREYFGESPENVEELKIIEELVNNY